MARIIERAGGASAFAEKYDIPLSTVTNWLYGYATAPRWLEKIFIKIEKNN